MAKRRARAKMNIPMCAACILLCLTMFSVHLSSGVVARYSTNTDGADSARVISFGNLTLTKEGANEQQIIPGMPLTLNAKVGFTGSESATYVFLEVIPSGSCEVSANGLTYTFKTDTVNSGASWTVDTTTRNEMPGWTYLNKFSVTKGGKTYDTYVYYISLAPNKAPTARQFFAADAATVSDELTADQIAGLQPIQIDFRAGVVQSNGFATVEAAWNSLSNH